MLLTNQVYQRCTNVSNLQEFAPSESSYMSKKFNVKRLRCLQVCVPRRVESWLYETVLNCL